MMVNVDHGLKCKKKKWIEYKKYRLLSYLYSKLMLVYCMAKYNWWNKQLFSVLIQARPIKTTIWYVLFANNLFCIANGLEIYFY